MWYKAVDKSGTWKPHVLSKAMSFALADDLCKRSPDTDLVDAEAPPHILVDVPGMILMNRAIRSVEVDGLTIKVPATDWMYVMSSLSLLRKRFFADGTEYYKLHQDTYVLVLTPDQRKSLLLAMEAQMKEAVAAGDADNKRFQNAINAINKDKTQIVSARVEAMNQADKGIKGSN
jgi:hypothetical protein